MGNRRYLPYSHTQAKVFWSDRQLSRFNCSIARTMHILNDEESKKKKQQCSTLFLINQFNYQFSFV